MIDLEEQFNFTNKQRHPTNASIIVYRFLNEAQAESFTELLVDAGIEFDVQVDEEDERKPIYFGLPRAKESETDRLNYIAIGRHRDKFIAAGPMRWIILTISIIVLVLAIVGAMFSD